MDALLTTIVIWLSAQFGLPMNFDHPRIELVPSIELATLSYRSLLSARRREVSAIQNREESVEKKRAVPTRFICWTHGPAARRLNYRSSFMKWCITFRIRPTLSTNAQRNLKNSPMKHRINGWVSSGVILKVNFSSMASRCLSEPLAQWQAGFIDRPRRPRRS